jgi:hypothetical protein
VDLGVAPVVKVVEMEKVHTISEKSEQSIIV